MKYKKLVKINENVMLSSRLMKLESVFRFMESTRGCTFFCTSFDKFEEQCFPCRTERSVNGPKRPKTAKNGSRYDGQQRSSGKRCDKAKNGDLLGGSFRVAGNDNLIRRTFFTVLHLFYSKI